MPILSGRSQASAFRQADNFADKGLYSRYSALAKRWNEHVPFACSTANPGRLSSGVTMASGQYLESAT